MESNVNLEKMIMSLGKDNTDFYVDFDTIADWVETKQVKNKKKKEGNDTIENLKKAIDTKDKIKIGNIFAYQKYQNQYKHMAKLINNNIDVIQEDEIYNILNRSNSVEEFCCNTTMNLINRISVAKFTEGRIIELDKTSLGMAENNYLDINNKIVLICGLDLNPKYNEAMNRKKKKYGSTNDPVYTLLELFAYMKPEEYRDMYNQAKLINWAKENQKSHLNQYRIEYILQTLRSAIENKSEEGFDEIKSFLNIVNIKDQKIISIIDKFKNIVKNRQPMIDGIIGLFESLLLNFNDVKDRNIIADQIDYILDCHKNDRKNISNNINKITLKPMVLEIENLTDPLSGKQMTRTLPFPIFSRKPLSLITYDTRCIPVTSVQQSVDATTDVDKAKKEANISYIKRIVSEYNKAVKTGVTINRDLIRFIENYPTRLMIDFSEYTTEMVFLDIQKLKETFLSKLINWAKENYKEVYDLIENISSINNKIESNNDDILFGTNILLLYSYILELYKRIGYFEKDVEISNNVSKTFGCGCHRDKTGNDLEEIIIDSLINDINHDLLDIVLTYYFDLTKDQREIVETINNISPEQEGNFRRFDNREFIDFVKRALKTEMTPFTIFTIKFDLFVKSNSQNYQDVINHIFVDNPLVFPGCVDVETFLIDYTKFITNDLKLVKLPYGIFKNMVKEIEGKPYLSAYLELTKLMVPDKTHLIDEILSEIDNLKENDIFINMVNQCNDFDDLFEKYKLFSNSVAIVPVGFNGKEFLFKEIPVERRPAKTIHLQKADRQKRQSIKALEIAKEKNDPIYQASNSMKESLDKAKKEANINYIKLIVSKYNGAIEKTTDDKVLLDFAFGENRRTLMTSFKTVFEKDTFLQKLIEWSKDNYREIYNIFENIIITNNKLEMTLLDKDPAIISTNILLLYSYIFELYKRIGYFDIDCSLFKNYKNFILQLDMNINLRTSEEFLNAFEKAYEKYLDENLK